MSLGGTAGQKGERGRGFACIGSRILGQYNRKIIGYTGPRDGGRAARVYEGHRGRGGGVNWPMARLKMVEGVGIACTGWVRTAWLCKCLPC